MLTGCVLRLINALGRRPNPGLRPQQLELLDHRVVVLGKGLAELRDAGAGPSPLPGG